MTHAQTNITRPYICPPVGRVWRAVSSVRSASSPRPSTGATRPLSLTLPRRARHSPIYHCITNRERAGVPRAQGPSASRRVARSRVQSAPSGPGSVSTSRPVGAGGVGCSRPRGPDRTLVSGRLPADASRADLGRVASLARTWWRAGESLVARDARRSTWRHGHVCTVCRESPGRRYGTWQYVQQFSGGGGTRIRPTWQRRSPSVARARAPPPLGDICALCSIYSAGGSIVSCFGII